MKRVLQVLGIVLFGTAGGCAEPGESGQVPPQADGELRASFTPPSDCAPYGPNSYGIDPARDRACFKKHARLHNVFLMIEKWRFPVPIPEGTDPAAQVLRATIEASVAPGAVVDSRIKRGLMGERGTNPKFVGPISQAPKTVPAGAAKCDGYTFAQEDNQVPAAPASCS